MSDTVSLDLPKGYKAVFRTDWLAGDQEEIDNLAGQYEHMPAGTIQLTTASRLLVSLHDAKGAEVETDLESLRKLPGAVYRPLVSKALEVCREANVDDPEGKEEG
jgi:hypothetical protein